MATTKQSPTELLNAMDLDEIRRRIAEMEKELEALRVIEKAVDVLRNGRTKKKLKRKRPPAENVDAEAGDDSEEELTPEEIVADALRRNGSLEYMALMRATGLCPRDLAGALRDPQFTKSDGRWDLTSNLR